MSTEYYDWLTDLIIDDHERLVEEKQYPIFKGVWELRSLLPTVFTKDFEDELNVDRLEIPLKGGGNIGIGKTQGQDPDLSVAIKFVDTAGNMTFNRFIITSESSREDFPFDISGPDYNDPKDTGQKRTKFLATFQPVKDVDWSKLEINSDEYLIGNAMCKYNEVKRIFISTHSFPQKN